MYVTLATVITLSVLLSETVLAQSESDERKIELKEEDLATRTSKTTEEDISIDRKVQPNEEDLITGSKAIEENISTDSESDKVYDETDTEPLGGLSVVDLIYRKRRQANNCEKNSEIVDETRSPDSEIQSNDDESVSIEEIELVSYEEISNGNNEETAIESRTNPRQMVEYLTPPAVDANCTYNQDETTAAGTELPEDLPLETEPQEEDGNLTF